VSNPLVAPSADGPVDPWAGVWIAEDIEAILAGVRNGSWIDTTVGAVSAGLDALAFVSDPIGSLLQYGVAWIMAAITEGAGLLIAGVRVTVRDAIAVLVSRLITYAAEEALTLGFATPVVLEQVTTLCAAWAARIAEWLRGLISSLGRRHGLAGKIGEAIEALKELLSRLRGKRETGRTNPSGQPDPARKPRGARTKAHPAGRRTGRCAGRMNGRTSWPRTATTSSRIRPRSRTARNPTIASRANISVSISDSPPPSVSLRWPTSRRPSMALP
jgi:hypothetical protein